MAISIGDHYESDIALLQDSTGRQIIRKTYKENVPCIRFLNKVLGNFYGSQTRDFMPVAYHEYNILKNLLPYRIAPIPLGIEKNCIFMSYEGAPITEEYANLSRADYIWQARNILGVLHKFDMRHNDLLERNILYKDGVIKLIDFTLTEIPGLDITSYLPDQNWARLNQDYKILTYAKNFPEHLSPEVKENKRHNYKKIASKVYNYHNLGVGVYDETEHEKTPYGSGERYNFDRMAMMVANYDFTGKNVLDIGCNSGWFSFQSALLGARRVLGIDYEIEGKMGESIKYARAFRDYLEAPVSILDQNLEVVDLELQAKLLDIKQFDATFILSVLHHIQDKKGLMGKIFENTKDVVFYEDHEFWNQIYDDNGQLIDVKGEGHRYGWNDDMSWQRKMASLDKHGKLVLDAFFNSWRKDDLLLDKYSEVKLLGFSEKRRPVLALYK